MRLRLLPCALSVLLLCVALVVATPAVEAHAATPQNGLIYFQEDGSTNVPAGIYSVEPDGLGRTRVASGGAFSVNASGTLIAYTSSLDEVTIATTDGRSSFVVIRDLEWSGISDIGWLPGDKGLVILSSFDQVSALNGNLFKVSLAGNPEDYPLTAHSAEVTRLDSTIHIHSDRLIGEGTPYCAGTLHVSPAGNAFSILRGTCNPYEDALSNVPTLVDLPAVTGSTAVDLSLLGTTFSPDGSKLVGEDGLYRDSGAGDIDFGELVIADANGLGSDAHVINRVATADASGIYHFRPHVDPAFSPDGKQLAFEEDLDDCDYDPANPRFCSPEGSFNRPNGDGFLRVGLFVAGVGHDAPTSQIADNGAHHPVWAPVPPSPASSAGKLVCNASPLHVSDSGLSRGVVGHVELPAPCTSSADGPITYRVVHDYHGGAGPLADDGFRPSWDGSTLGYLSFNDRTPNGTYGGAAGGRPTSANIVYQARDSAGNVATGTLPVTVALLPVCSPSDGGTVTTPATIRIACTDPQGRQLAYSVQSPPTQGSVSQVPGSDRFLYTPKPGAHGTDTFTVAASNGSGTSTSVVGVTIDGAPSCTPLSDVVPFSSTVTLGVACTDPNGDPLTYEAMPPTPTGSVRASAAAGQLSLSALPSFHGTASVPVRVSDGGSVVTEVQTVRVNGAPSCQPITAATNKPITLTLSCTDPEGDPITGYEFQGASLAATSVANQFVYSPPDPDRTETVPFTYTASDAGGPGSPAAVAVRYSPRPHCSEAAGSTEVSAPVSIRLACAAGQGDSGTLTLAAGSVAPGHGALSAVDSTAQTVTYTPTAGYHGVDTFSYDATDANGTSDEQRVTVDVGDMSPTCTAVATTTTADTLSLPLACDPQGGPALTYQLVTQPKLGAATLDPASGVVSYTRGSYDGAYPNVDKDTGVDTFTYRATNGNGTSLTATATVKLNGLPVTCSSSTVADAVFAGDGPVAADPPCNLYAYDNAAPTMDVVTPPQSGNLIKNNVSGQTAYLPNDGFVGTDSYAYRYHDQWGDSSTVTESVTVNSARPVCQSGTLNTTQGTPIVLTATCTSSTGVAPTVTFQPQFLASSCGCMPGSVVDPATNTFTPPAGKTAGYSFAIVAVDSNGGRTAGIGGPRLLVNVLPPAPACSDQNATVQAGTPQQITLTCTDPAAPMGAKAGAETSAAPQTASASHPDLAYGVAGDPTAGTLNGLDPAAGSVTVNADADAVGTDTASYDASSVGGLSRPATVHLTVTAPAPDCSDLNVSAVGSASIPLKLDCVVGTGSSLSYSVAGQAAHGTVSSVSDDGGLTYTPAAGWDGTDTFTYQATADGVTSAPATATVTVAALPPTCTATSVDTAAATPVHAVVSCVDTVKGEPLSYQIKRLPTAGTLAGLDATTGALDFTPDMGFAGAESLTYVATASDGRTAEGILVIVVAAPVTPAPMGPPVPVPAPGVPITPIVAPAPPSVVTAPVATPPVIAPPVIAPAVPKPAPKAPSLSVGRVSGDLHTASGSVTLPYRLSAKAPVEEVFSLQATGRKVGGRCVAATRRNARAPACTLLIPVGVLRFTGQAGLTQQRLTAVVGRRRLAPGSYQISVIAVSADGRHSTTRTTTFTVVR